MSFPRGPQQGRRHVTGGEDSVWRLSFDSVELFDLQIPTPCYLRLNAISPRFSLASNECRLLSQAKKGEFSSFVTVRLPQVLGDHTMFLAQNIETHTWKAPQQLVLSDDPVKFEAGSVRVINLSALPVEVQRNGKMELNPIAPGESMVLSGHSGQEETSSITVLTGGPNDS